MSALPESPVREYAKRVEVLIAAKINEPREIPGPYKYADTDVVWRGGVRHGLALAASIAIDEEPEPGQETTYFEYRVTSADLAFTREVWRDDLAEVEQELTALARTEVFGELFIERRTVTVTQPVRVDQDGEPTP